MSHFSDDEITLYIIEPEALSNRVEFEEHVFGCAECLGRFKVEQAITDILRRAETFEAAEAVAAPPDRWKQLQTLQLAVEQENEAAKDLLKGHLQSAARFAWAMARIIRNPRFHTAGVVRLLCRVANEQCYKDLLHARNLADVAISIAGSLSSTGYSPDLLMHLRGRAWKERANALRLLGENADALESLLRAERCFRETRDPRLGIASVWYIRSCVYVAEERFSEALRLARASARIYSANGETQQYMKCRRVQATILFERHDFAAAREITLEEADYAAKFADPGWLALALHSLADIDLELKIGDHGRTLAELAIRLFRDLDQPIPLLMSEWTLARIVSAEGMHEAAAEKLRALQADFTRRSMFSEAAIVAVDLMTVLNCAGMNEELRSTANDLVVRTARGGMPTAAVKAVTSIRDAIDAGTLSQHALDRVRDFLRRLEGHPALNFTVVPA